MFKYKVKNMEPFKDGTILDGRFVKPGEILVIDEQTRNKMVQSGALLEELEILIPNPLKTVAPVEEPVVAPVEVAQERKQKKAPVKAKGKVKKDAN